MAAIIYEYSQSNYSRSFLFDQEDSSSTAGQRASTMWTGYVYALNFIQPTAASDSLSPYLMQFKGCCELILEINTATHDDWNSIPEHQD